MSSIDALLDSLFEALTAGDGTPAVDPHMALKPDPKVASYFVPAPCPALSLEEMRRPDGGDAMAEVVRVLGDLPPELRATMVACIKAVYDALAAEASDDAPAEPPSLIYALH